MRVLRLEIFTLLRVLFVLEPLGQLMRLVPAPAPKLDHRVDQHHERYNRHKQQLGHIEIERRQYLVPGCLLESDALTFEGC